MDAPYSLARGAGAPHRQTPEVLGMVPELLGLVDGQTLLGQQQSAPVFGLDEISDGRQLLSLFFAGNRISFGTGRLNALRTRKGFMKRVRYISRFATTLTPQDIAQIVETSQKNNPGRNITGMLMASGDLFYQLLEGPRDEIDSLYALITKDTRHEQVLLLDSETGDFERICPDWAMQAVDLSLKSSAETGPISALLEMICVQRQMADKALKALDEYTWEGLLSTANEKPD